MFFLSAWRLKVLYTTCHHSPFTHIHTLGAVITGCHLLIRSTNHSHTCTNAVIEQLRAQVNVSLKDTSSCRHAGIEPMTFWSPDDSCLSHTNRCATHIDARTHRRTQYNNIQRDAWSIRNAWLGLFCACQGTPALWYTRTTHTQRHTKTNTTSFSFPSRVKSLDHCIQMRESD